MGTHAAGETRIGDELLAAGLLAAWRMRERVRPAPQASAPAERFGAFEVIEEIAHGGMGTVLRARDAELGREVALKILREDLEHEPALRARFLQEAQIAGQLQHPGVVPIYALGRTAEGSPFFAMKLVEGRTLASLLAARRAAGEDRHRYLSIFAQVCHTVAYAHSRGVIHRDLKPANVMVGAFGEVQVVDWGLAKLIAATGTDAGANSSAPVHTRKWAAHTDSLPGAVLGTPRYMSPEQACGDVDHLDARTDVFALGGTLCEILTGRPPYSSDSACDEARFALLSPARESLQDCGADAELVALCLRCLAPEPADRPVDAGELAAALTKYLESAEARVRAAELSAAEARASADAERRARKLTLALAGSVVLTVVAGIVGYVWIDLERTRRERETSSAVQAALDETARLRGQAETTGDLLAWRDALAAVERARALVATGTAGRALAQRVESVHAEISASESRARARDELERSNRELLARLDQVRAPEGDSVYPTDWAEVDTQLALAFAQHGLAVDGGDAASIASELQRRGIEIEVAAQLDEWWRVRILAGRDGADRLLDLASAADTDPTRRRLRAALRSQDRSLLESFANEQRTSELPAATLGVLGSALARVGALEESLRVYRAALELHPDDFVLHVGLAHLHLQATPKRPADSLAELRAALALRPQSVLVRHEIGRILFEELGRGEEALAVFRRACAGDRPDAHMLRHLAVLLMNQGQSGETLEVARKWARVQPADPEAQRMIATALENLGDLAGAEQGFRDAIAAHPDSADLWWSWADMLQAQGRNAEAIEAYRAAVQRSPGMVAPRWELVSMLRAAGDLDQAIDLLRDGIALAGGDECAYQWQYLAICLQQRGDLEPAIDALEKANESIAKDQAARARILLGLGRALALRGDLPEAEQRLDESLRVAPESTEAHADLGYVLLERGRFSDALAHLRRGGELGGADRKGSLASRECLDRAEGLARLEPGFEQHIAARTLPDETPARFAFATWARERGEIDASARALDAIAGELGDALGEPMLTRARRVASIWLAAAGASFDAQPDHLRWRTRAREWLSEVLDRAERVASTAEPSQRRLMAAQLSAWLQSPDFADVRAEKLLELTESEQRAWRELWARADDLARSWRDG
jgi:serine/threonine-protein kinase